MEGFDYAQARRDFSLDIPKDFNFAFDVLRPRALNADKTAIIEIDKSGTRVTGSRTCCWGSARLRVISPLS